ncbi:MAG: hypothetical protein ACRC1P_00435 [Cellulosilyticaceae bacterium]
MSTLHTVALFEFKNLLCSPIYWLGWLATIGWAVIWDSPLRSGVLWTDRHCAYRFGHGIVTLGCFILAIIFANSFHSDRTTKSPLTLFTQPIKSYHYALGKFLGIFIGSFIPIFLGMIFYLFIPIFLGGQMYSPKVFIEVLILYILPSIFFYSSLCYLSVVALKEFLFATLLPIIYLLSIETSIWQISVRIPGDLLSPLTYGMADVTTAATIYGNTLLNRGMILALGLVLLTLSVMSYSHKKYL